MWVHTVFITRDDQFVARDDHLVARHNLVVLLWSYIMPKKIIILYSILGFFPFEKPLCGGVSGDKVGWITRSTKEQVNNYELFCY